MIHLLNHQRYYQNQNLKQGQNTDKSSTTTIDDNDHDSKHIPASASEGGKRKDNDDGSQTTHDVGQAIESTRTKPNPKPRRQRTKPRTKSTITCSRVSLDDPIMQHRQNWHNVILPRLRSIVEAVYSIRATDDKRYRMLHAHASSLASGGVSGGGRHGTRRSGTSTGDDTECWEIVFEECPWLRDCDTAFSRY